MCVQNEKNTEQESGGGLGLAALVFSLPNDTLHNHLHMIDFHIFFSNLINFIHSFVLNVSSPAICFSRIRVLILPMKKHSISTQTPSPRVNVAP